MRYLYQQFNTDKKNLEHIDWFVVHHKDYILKKGAIVEKDLENLKTQIINKNYFYSDLVSHYDHIVDQFKNDPYDYKFDVLGEDKEVESSILNDYFIEVEDDHKKYFIPYNYALNNKAQNPEATEKFNELLKTSQQKTLAQFQAIENRYQFYLQSGILNAVNRFKRINFGKAHNFPVLFLTFGIYHLLLIALLNVTQLGSILIDTLFNGFHLVENVSYYFSSCPIWMSLIVFGLVIYFIFLDIIYIYSIYYIVYSTLKHRYVYKHYLKTEELHKVFMEDYKKARSGIEQNIEKVNHRYSCYIPLIKQTSQTFKFEWIYFRITKFKKLMRVYEVQQPDTPIDFFYRRKITRQILWESLLLVVSFALLFF